MPSLHSLLLDRDGTLIEERNYLCDPAQVALAAGAGQALARLCGRGVRLFVVSNQSGIGRGYFPARACLDVNARVEADLAAFGVRIAASVFCPHAPDEGCGCRKPSPGMWDELVRRHGLRPETSAMVGDNASDVAFGRGCGLARTILVLTGHGRRYAEALGLPMPEAGWVEIDKPGPKRPDAVAVDLPAALDYLERSMGLGA